MTVEYKESDVKEFIKRLPEISVEPPTVHLAMMCVRSKKVKELLGYKLSDLVVERDIIRAVMHSGGVELSVGEIESNW